MNKITLGKTNLVIEKNGFGCLPIQRIREQDAVDLLHKAYDGGINFFDTARAYSDSEQKVGAAFSSMRDKIVLATKTGAQTAEGFRKDLETSLRTLKTDYIDIYQFHNPAFCPKPGGEDGLYDAALEAKSRAKFATFRSRTTASPWRTRPSTRASTRPCSFRSATSRASRRWSSSESAAKQTWALSP